MCLDPTARQSYEMACKAQVVDMHQEYDTGDTGAPRGAIYQEQ
jgi:hypothetical protein